MNFKYTVSTLIILCLCSFTKADSDKKFVKKARLKFPSEEMQNRISLDKIVDSTYHFLYTSIDSKGVKYSVTLKSTKKVLDANQVLKQNTKAVEFDGPYKKMFNNIVLNKGIYVNGHPDGEFIERDKKGVLKERSYYKWDGKKLHKRVEYYGLDSVLLKECHFIGKKRDGKETIYKSDKQVLETIEYAKGKKNGKIESFYANGQNKMTAVYKDNEFVSGKLFLENGKETDYRSIIRKPGFKGGFDEICKYFEIKILQKNLKVYEGYTLGLSLSVGADGVIKSHKVSYQSKPIDSIEKVVKEAVKQLPRMIPFMYEGVAMESKMNLLFTFEQEGTQLKVVELEDWRIYNNVNMCKYFFYGQKKVGDWDADDMVNMMPEFPGGDDALRQFIARSLRYPVSAQKAAVQGRVFVQFIVTQKGKVSHVKLARGVDEALDNEAMRVVKNMPRWKPGCQYGSAKKVSYTIPVNFVLR